MTSPELIMGARHASLTDLVGVLRAQHAAKLDVVAPARDLRAVGGYLRVAGVGEARLTERGVDIPSVVLRPTALADSAVAGKLGIPVGYLRRLRTEHLGLYDANVNGWLDTAPASRRFLIRALVDGEGGGVLRGFLSDSFRIVDNLDVLMAALQGIREAGAQVEITEADLTESRMYVKVRSETVAAQAPQLLAGYTSPFTGARGAENPLVFAGFVISNSETGAGKFRIVPRLEVKVCDNGMILDKHALSAVHLGGRLPEGQIQWSADTQQAALDLVIKKARDAVAAFLDPGVRRPRARRHHPRRRRPRG